MSTRPISVTVVNTKTNETIEFTSISKAVKFLGIPRAAIVTHFLHTNNFTRGIYDISKTDIAYIVKEKYVKPFASGYWGYHINTGATYQKTLSEWADYFGMPRQKSTNLIFRLIPCKAVYKNMLFQIVVENAKPVWPSQQEIAKIRHYGDKTGTKTPIEVAVWDIVEDRILKYPSAYQVGAAFNVKTTTIRVFMESFSAYQGRYVFRRVPKNGDVIWPVIADLRFPKNVARATTAEEKQAYKNMLNQVRAKHDLLPLA